MQPRTVVIFAIRALTLTGKALDGPVLAALRGGMEVLEWPEAWEKNSQRVCVLF